MQYVTRQKLFPSKPISTASVLKTHYLISVALLSLSFQAYAEPLNTQLPVTIDLPMQPLAESLKQFSKKTGLSIAVDSELVKDKMAPAVKGNYESTEALKKLLNDSGLEANME